MSIKFDLKIQNPLKRSFFKKFRNLKNPFALHLY